MVDLSFLQQFTKGDKGKMERYIRLYLNTAPKTLRQMEQSLRRKDWEQVRIHAHSLKPQAEYMGIAALKETLVAIETGVREQRYQALAALCSKASQLHRQSSTLLRNSL